MIHKRNVFSEEIFSKVSHSQIIEIFIPIKMDVIVYDFVSFDYGTYINVQFCTPKQCNDAPTSTRNNYTNAHQ